ncbi:MAG: PD-(D/E)XK nuclease family protein [Ignisphaera sp.]|uniref:CRISPR-associated protein Cas4 n=1 Tax=Ignisphaera aggregans TaxID=334771 RepID=A0A7C4NTS2_9CREN
MSEFKLVDIIYRHRIEETVKRIDKKLDNEFYITDLVYCPLKYKYQKLYKELTIASAINPTTLLGEFAHHGIEKMLIEILGPDSVKTEVETEKSIEVEGILYIIRGRVDALIGDYIVEIKTSKSDASIPQNHHILQTRLYLWLTGYRKALLLYVTANRIAEFVIDKPATDGEVSDLVRGIIVGAPAPRYSWECRYCPYSVLCPDKRIFVGVTEA